MSNIFQRLYTRTMSIALTLVVDRTNQIPITICRELNNFVDLKFKMVTMFKIIIYQQFIHN